LSLAIGTRIGHYEVIAPLGAGGMGEVYRARDHKLNRDVALKVVSASAVDADHLRRLVREAQSLAALNHPHIAQIYGLEDSTATRALVMELVDGEDLSARIARGSIPLDEALEIARQIADALEAAHDVGIVHRDLKPANVKVRADGTVKVLDFGLAKAPDTADGRRQAATGTLADSPTFISQATEAGVILGTAAYMSPEQARGKPVDKRTDIWAFGVVLYEMLAGRAAFAGETVTDLLAAIVSREPDWSQLPPTVPPRVDHLLRRCLDRDARTRLRDIGEARVELARRAWEGQTSRAPAAKPRSMAARLAPWAVALGAAITAAAIWVGRPRVDAPVKKLELALPADGLGFALSPDGQRIAFRSHGAVVVNDFTRLESHPLVSSTPGQRSFVFWSHDGRFIAYSDADGKLWTIPVGGGAPRLVCTIPETRQILGAAWFQNDVIVFAVWRGSVYRVAASGGQPAVLLTIDPAKEIDIHEVVALPDNRALLATHLFTPGGNDYQVELVGVEPPASRQIVLSGGFLPVGLATSGHILMRRFDVNRGVWAFPYSNRWPLSVDNAFLVAPGAMSASVSTDGSVLYSLESSAAQMHELVWIARTGQVVGQVGTAQVDLGTPALSPDGHLVAFTARTGDNADVWVRDLRTDLQSRVTSEADDQGMPSWFPNGKRLLYAEAGGMNNRIAARNADGSGGRQELGLGMTPALSPDGTRVVFSIDERGANHLRVADVAADGTLGEARKVFAASPEPDARQGRVSPDGRLLAFTERTYSGLPEVFLTTFPSGEGRWPISNGGGRSPVWSRSGELFFVSGATAGPKDMMAATVNQTQNVTVGSPVKLFAIAEELAGGPNGPTYDVSGDGKRLLMVRSRGATFTSQRWVLVQNWLTEFTHEPKP
jgi:Tol biopolymer transport system component